MRIPETRLFRTPDQSCIFHHEKSGFYTWHHHPEYELVLITNGKGIRMIGDHIDRFENNDLILLGPYLPHEWRCDDSYLQPTKGFMGEAIVIQFLQDSFWDNFFALPENKDLNLFLSKSRQGCQIYGTGKKKIISIMKQMLSMDETERLYALFSIFKCFSSSKEFRQLSSPSFLGSFKVNESQPLQKAVQYILQNFQNNIRINDLLDISNMSGTTFFMSFKKMYGMTFKRYLSSIRIGYACRLLGENTMSISQISYECGFGNLSNFNRQFKMIKGCSPRDYKKQHKW